jgi:flavin reductase (DIM6/NTAB) family NADH-FMN oxidoreductase RutF
MSSAPAQVYTLLRDFTSPVVAITSSASGRGNGMIANSVQRASLVPDRPRLSVYILKTNYSHELILASGLLGVHLLRADQWGLVSRLGLTSGRDGGKLAGLETSSGETGCPPLTDVYAAFECRVANIMDAGSSTFFLADVVSVRRGEPGPIMTSTHFRANMPPDLRKAYEAGLARAQKDLAALAGTIEPRTWSGPTSPP